MLHHPLLISHLSKLPPFAKATWWGQNHFDSHKRTKCMGRPIKYATRYTPWPVTSGTPWGRPVLTGRNLMTDHRMTAARGGIKAQMWQYCDLAMLCLHGTTNNRADPGLIPAYLSGDQ